MSIAIRSREFASVQLMLDNGIHINSRAPLPLSNVVRWRELASAEKLLDLGAQFSEATWVEVLHPGQNQIIKILLGCGANPNTTHRWHSNALQCATWKTTQKLMPFLNAVVNRVPNRGWAPSKGLSITG
jgi:hypothetical protein